MKMLERIFSVKNEYGPEKNHKVVTFWGMKMKFCSTKNINKIYTNIIPKEGFIYEGNPEFGLCSMKERMKKGFLEYKDMIITNKVIGDMFIKKAKTIVNIGSGVGTFEWQNAKRFTQIKFVASEFEKSQLNWTKENRMIANVTYCSDDMKTLLEKYGKFDLAVSIDVIEHVKEYKKFLDEFVQLSDKAVISTPNRDRYYTKEHLIKPEFNQHVQEWNAGELFFILKMYYKTVKLYSLIDDYNSEEITEVGLYSQYNKLIAYCEN